MGYIPQLEKFSRVFLGLIIVVVFFAAGNKGVFKTFQDAIAGTGSGSGTTTTGGTF